MKKNHLLLVLIAGFAMFSCGGAKSDENENKDEKQTICDVENGIAVSVQDYYYSMSDTLIYSTPDFQIVNSDYKWINDSTITLKFSNYDPKTIVGAKTECC